MKITYIAIVSFALLAAPAAMAEWQVVNNFDSGSTDGVSFFDNDDEDVNPTGGISIIPDPSDATKGILEFNPGDFTNGTDTYNTWMAMNFPDIDGVGTVYNRISRGEMVDVVWGTTPVGDDEEPRAYGSFSSALRFELDGILDYRDDNEELENSGYIEVEGGITEADTWYEAWFVVDSVNNTYDAYIKGGETWPEQTQVVAGAVFRFQGEDPQNHFYLRMTTGNTETPKSVDPVWIDDVFVDITGENLATPGDDVVITDPGVAPTENGTGLLTNVSTNTTIAANDSLIVGFVIDADEGSRRVLIRGVGPGLGAFGVDGTMADPVITVHRTMGADPAVEVATNTNWGDNSNASSIAATAVAVGAFVLPEGSMDAALMLFLEPGSYTVTVTSESGGAGRAIAEVYKIK